MILEKSSCAPADVRILFGASIRKDRYEVGGEFQDYFKAPSLQKKNGKFYFDLAGENKKQLLNGGALEKNILDFEFCTVGENEDFYSFRKEKESAGRMVSFIALTPEPAFH